MPPLSTPLRGLLTIPNVFLGAPPRRRTAAAPFRPAPAPLAPVVCQAAPSGRSTRPAPRRSGTQPRRGRPGGPPDASVGKQRLNKALAATGVASRRGADEMIFAGRVAVNGAIVKEPGIQVDLSRDKLAVDGRPLSITAATKKFYFALNKPKGYICSNKGDGADGSGDRLVVDLFADWIKGWKARHPGAGAPPRLFTVGRLDVASVGLIFVTNDGDWAQEVQHPSSGLTKEYVVTLNRRPGRAELEALQEGCEIDGVRVTPVAVGIDDSDASKQNRIRIILSEGRNREVRRLAEAAGLEVRQLRRVRVGGYRLPRNLGFGQFVELRSFEVRRVTDRGADRSV